MQLVLNNFGSAEKHVKLLVSVFQGLFPPIHVQTMHLSQARRIVLLNYNEESQTIDWRHYLISVRPVGVSRRVRRVIEGSSGHKTANPSSSSFTKKIPNLSSTVDISEYLLGRREGGEELGFETDASSASEAESDVEEGGKSSSHVQLPDSYIGRGNVRDSQRAVRLLELGPRMELRCVKIEEGIPGAGKDAKGNSSGGNDVLWHDYVKKSSAETGQQRKAMMEKEKERSRRRKEQEANVLRKKQEKEAAKTSKRGKPAEGSEVNTEEASDKEEKDEGVEEEEDEFLYEDMHGNEGVPNETEALFEEDDEVIGDEDSVGEESEGELEEEDDDDDDENHDDSDLSPIEIGFEAIDSDSELEDISSKKVKKHKINIEQH